MAWREWVRTVEIEPSLYAADFAQLGDQIRGLLDGGALVFHFDVGDGHFVEPITIGPIVLESIAPIIHERGGVIDVHLMVEEPDKHIPQIARAGGDSVTFHVEASGDPGTTIALARELELGVGVAFKPETTVTDAAKAAEGADLCLCMSIEPGYSGQEFMPEALPRIEELRFAAAGRRLHPGGRRHLARQRARGPRRGREPVRHRERPLPARGSAARVPPLRPGAGVTFLERALELAERGRGTTHPNPVVGAVVVRDGEIVGEGWHERAGGPHAEVVALRAAGERARGATLYVTLAPCSRHGRTPPCVDAVVAAGITRVVVGADDPTQDGVAQLRERGVEVELADSFASRRQNEAWLTWAGSAARS